MTTIRGKLPIALMFTPKVSTTSVFEAPIRITSGTYSNGSRFEMYGDLSTHCAATLIVELRKALRAVRDERVRALNGDVIEAEKPLP
jgi:hypothetical protein